MPIGTGELVILVALLAVAMLVLDGVVARRPERGRRWRLLAASGVLLVFVAIASGHAVAR